MGVPRTFFKIPTVAAVVWVTVGAIVVVMLAESTFAQRRRGRSGRRYGLYGSGGYHASTAIEGARRGMADVIRARSESAMNLADAANTMQDVKLKNMQNRLAAAEIYWERRKVYDREVEAREQKRIEKRRAFVARRNKPLTSADVDTVTGAIGWPYILQDEPYTPYRDEYERVFAAWAHNGYLTGKEIMDLNNAYQDWRKPLIAKRKDYPPEDWKVALRFTGRLVDMARDAPK